MSTPSMTIVVLLGLLLAQPQEGAAQSAVPDRRHAEQLAWAGRTSEALALFNRIVEIDPGDIESRLWIARLDLRLGRVAKAESGFRAVLAEHADNVDASIGLGMTLTRTGSWGEALAVLQRVEAAAGNNADLFAAFAHAYRHGGDDRRALDYFRRARMLAPEDPDTALGFEAVTRAYGHWVGPRSLQSMGSARDERNLRPHRRRSADLSAAAPRSRRAVGVLNWSHFRLLLAVSVLFGAATTLVAVFMSDLATRKYPLPRDLALLLAAATFENAGYRQLNSWWGCVGTWQAATGRGEWGPMTRKTF